MPNEGKDSSATSHYQYASGAGSEAPHAHFPAAFSESTIFEHAVHRIHRGLSRAGIQTPVAAPRASSGLKKRPTAERCSPPFINGAIASADSQAVMVIMRSPTVTPSQLINPGMESISIATLRLLSLTCSCSWALRASSHVMLNAPGVAVFPFDARTLVPKPKGPIALG